MLKKFNNVRDEELVLKYKAKKDEDIELELIERYKIHSKKLASEQYQKYRYVFQIEYEDVYATILASVITAIRSFKVKQNTSFFKLWKTIATNEINLYVTKMPLLKLEANIGYITTSRDISNDNMVLSSSNKSEETSIDLSHEIERILVSNKDSFDPKDRDIFILYVSGYSITDIANETGLKYHYVRSRINSIKEKIQKYFVHS